MKAIIFCAETLDGKIARGPSDPIDWTTAADKKIFAAETKKAGVVVMGRRTFESLGQPLPDRLNIVLTHRPPATGDEAGRVEFMAEKPATFLSSLAQRGYTTVFIIGGAQTNTLFLRENLVNEIWLTLTPRIFGVGLSLVGAVDLNLSLKLVSVDRLEQDLLLLKYRLPKAT